MIVKTYEELFGKKLTIRDLINGFNENTKTGEVIAFGGKLNVRPPYQREFVYEIPKQVAVIDTVLKGYPLNVMYWAKSDDGKYELMDGQQRTMSICKFSEDQYSIQLDIAGKIVSKTFSNLGSKTEDFLNYPLTVYICDGTKDEKLAWFQIINISGVKLTEQEMKNAIHNGSWVTDSKKYFSRIDGEGYLSEGHVSNGYTYGDYLNVVGGTKSEKENAVVRQKLLEIVLKWAVHAHNITTQSEETLDSYMDIHEKDPNARSLWRYYEDVMEWVKETFPTYNSEMKKVEWGLLYNKFQHELNVANQRGDKDTIAHFNDNAKHADVRVQQIFKMVDADDSGASYQKSAVYQAVLFDEYKVINNRKFDKKDIKWALKKQGGKCACCHKDLNEADAQGDHIKPWSKGGPTSRNNLQALCPSCNGRKKAHDIRYVPWDGKEYEPIDLGNFTHKNTDSL